MYKNKNYQYGYLPKINYWLGNDRGNIEWGFRTRHPSGT